MQRVQVLEVREHQSLEPSFKSLCLFPIRPFGNHWRLIYEQAIRRVQHRFFALVAAPSDAAAAAIAAH
jgi:hypothetical protein